MRLIKDGGQIVHYGGSIGADFGGNDGSILFLRIIGSSTFRTITVNFIYILHRISTSSL